MIKYPKYLLSITLLLFITILNVNSANAFDPNNFCLYQKNPNAALLLLQNNNPNRQQMVSEANRRSISTVMYQKVGILSNKRIVSDMSIINSGHTLKWYSVCKTPDKKEYMCGYYHYYKDRENYSYRIQCTSYDEDEEEEDKICHKTIPAHMSCGGANSKFADFTNSCTHVPTQTIEVPCE